MPIIFICSVPFGGGERLAKSLAQKLGYRYVSREDVVATANECGIPVGKLEVAMVKRPAFQERLGRLKERYLAVATATICERAAEGDIVYYGRAGHLLLPGVSHVLRVRIIPDQPQRVESAMQRTRLSKEKAEKFLAEVDGDIRNWVHFVHGVDMDDPRKYDFIINLERTSLENASTALCAIADLPDFRPTPSSQKAMQDRLLQSRARIALALDERTSGLDLTVRASDGVVTITYMPRQARESPLIPEVLAAVPGCRELRCTMASTNILWIQEAFDAGSPAFSEVTELARRWGAAVEVLRYGPQGAESEAVGVAPAPAASMKAETGGVEDDVAEHPVPTEGAFRGVIEALVQSGQSGGAQSVSGGRDKLLGAINPDIPYSLVVVGDLFLDKPAAARTRLCRELAMFLGDHVKAPILSTADLASKLRLGPKELAKAVSCGALLVLFYAVVFLRQDGLLSLLGGAVHKTTPWLASLVVALLAPVVAVLYGTLLAAAMKWLKME